MSVVKKALNIPLRDQLRLIPRQSIRRTTLTKTLSSWKSEEDYQQLPDLLKEWHSKQLGLKKQQREKICRKTSEYPALLFEILRNPQAYGLWTDVEEVTFFLRGIGQNQVPVEQSLTMMTDVLAVYSGPTKRVGSRVVGTAVTVLSKIVQRAPENRKLFTLLEAAIQELCSIWSSAHPGTLRSNSAYSLAKNVARDYEAIRVGIARSKAILAPDSAIADSLDRIMADIDEYLILYKSLK